ncbi:MAG: serine/threonine-protein kinase [Mariprofundaceae bacterium]|nr:serine/threonine-protein kinase [Mariprofundaceae bacterium]
MIKSGTAHLGQYRLDSELGSGGMGIVYRATDEKLHREVAIKVLHPHLLQNEDLRERFRREARMHAQLMHPNVVTLLSIYEDAEHMALIMEMVHGKNLREYLRTAKKHAITDLVRIAQAILLGLEAAHHIGLVHRDLKPANVLLADNGDIKLMDFGLAKPAKGDDDLTQSGATVGSFRYMAPEQILNQPIDARTDLYAFGILLYQMMTGKLPFDASAQGGGEFEIMEKQVRESPVSPHELNRSLPLEISDLILRLLAKSPDDRPETCALVHQELDIIARNLSSKVMAPGLSKSSVNIPSHSNAAIAKGLLKASVRNIGLKCSKLLGMLGSVFPTKGAFASGRDKQMSHKWKGIMTWGGAVLILILLGWVLVSVMRVAERPAIVSEPVLQESASENHEEYLEIKSDVVVKEKKVLQVPVVKKQGNAVVKEKKVLQVRVVKKQQKPPVVKPVKKVSKPKKTTKSTHIVRLVTDTVGYKVTRSDGSKVDISKPHEFKGGQHLYFETLKSYRGKKYFTAYKKAQIRLYLDKSVSLRKIILHKASIGKLNFKGGYIKLAVQDDKHRWHEVFTREGNDIDIAVTIPKSKLPARIIGARLRFRSPEPITIGPIDLIR